MKCREVEEQLLEDLRRQEDPLLRQHLANCSGCRKLAQELRQLEGLKELFRDQVSAPDDFVHRVVSQALQERKRVFLGWSRWAAGIFLMLGLGAMLAGTSAWPGWWGERQPLFGKTGEVSPWVEDQQPPLPSTLPYLHEGQRFVEIPVESSEDSEYILRVPSTIEVVQSDLHNDFFLRQISH